MAPLTNIDQEGFASAAFHSYPDLLKWDPYSGDYGPGFLGMSLGQCVYIVSNSKYGDLVFGGNIDKAASSTTSIVAEPRDAVRKRVFIADLGLKVEVSAGAIQKVTYDKTKQEVSLSIAPGATTAALQAKSAIVWLKQPGSSNVGYTVSGLTKQRGGWAVNFSGGASTVKITKA